MPYDLQLLGFTFTLLAALAMLVKYERRLSRWLMRDRRRRRKPAVRLSVLR